MNTVIIVAIVFGSLVVLAGVLCGTVILILRMRRSGITSKASKEEAKMVQEIYRGLEKMEKRIEALETILMDSQELSGDRK